jgi:hypothetical protein
VTDLGLEGPATILLGDVYTEVAADVGERSAIAARLDRSA